MPGVYLELWRWSLIAGDLDGEEILARCVRIKYGGACVSIELRKLARGSVIAPASLARCGHQKPYRDSRWRETHFPKLL